MEAALSSPLGMCWTQQLTPNNRTRLVPEGGFQLAHTLTMVKPDTRLDQGETHRAVAEGGLCLDVLQPTEAVGK